jgi:hypothetical protein
MASRTDEVLAAWQTVAHTTSRPAEAPLPRRSSSVSIGLIGGVAIVLVMVVGLALRGSPTRPGAPSGTSLITIEAGLAPRMAAEEVEALALRHIHLMEGMVGTVVRPARILSVTATTASGVATLEPKAGQQEPPAAGIQWLVRAEGTFTNSRTPPGASPMTAATGYFVLDDADGSIINFGFP